MENKLEKKYGLFMAICMIVGTVIGSGVFFKAQTILQKTEGNMPLGIVAWLIGGAVMLACVLAFAAMAQKYEKVNGLVDYAEALVGKSYAYYIGWFMATTYIPALVCVLAWLSARYTLVFVTSCWPNFPLLISADAGGCITGPECIALMMAYLAGGYALNAMSPRLAGKFQTSTAVIKLIPLALMAVGGVIAGLMSPTHMLVSNFTTASVGFGSNGAVLLSSVCATAFAYEGWIIATSINSELKDAKRNLPRALIIGGIIVILVYVLYYIGVAGGASVQQLMDEGATVAFTNVFGGVLGNILNLFVAISCLGTMNGLLLGCTRAMYALAARNEGPCPELFVQVDKKSNMPTNSAIFALVLSALWGLYFYLSNVAGTFNNLVVFEGTLLESVVLLFDPSELSIITLYAMYIPIFVMWMKKEKDESFVKRFVLPVLAIAASLFMVFACIVGHGVRNLWFLLVFAVVMLVGALVRGKNRPLPVQEHDDNGDIEGYIKLMEQRQDLAAVSDEIPVVLDAQRMRDFSARTGKPMGIVFDNRPFYMVLSDLCMAGDTEYAYSRVVYPEQGSNGSVAVVRRGEEYGLLRIFRHPPRLESLEFPRGFAAKGLSPEENIRKELSEEMCAQVVSVKYIGDVRADTGLSSGSAQVYLAEVGETRVPLGYEGIRDIVWLSGEELRSKISSGEISDGFTLSALTLLNCSL